LINVLISVSNTSKSHPLVCAEMIDPVILREKEQDTRGVKVRASILCAALPVFDEILAHSSAEKPWPVITLDCSAQELSSFVTLLSSQAHDAPAVLTPQQLVDHSASAMHMLDKY
jgi:hypothetical protein